MAGRLTSSEKTGSSTENRSRKKENQPV